MADTRRSEFVIFGLVLLGALPGVVYLLLQVVLASGKLDTATLRWAAGQSFLFSLVAPFATIAQHSALRCCGSAERGWC